MNSHCSSYTQEDLVVLGYHIPTVLNVAQGKRMARISLANRAHHISMVDLSESGITRAPTQSVIRPRFKRCGYKIPKVRHFDELKLADDNSPGIHPS